MSRSGTQQSSADRRARGLRRLEAWLPAETIAKLDAICEHSGYSRAEQVRGMIDADYDSMLRATRPNRRAKP